MRFGRLRSTLCVLLLVIFGAVSLRAIVRAEGDRRVALSFDQARLLVEDLARARSFYTRVVGLRVGFENETYVELESDSGVSIGLFGRQAMAAALGRAAVPLEPPEPDRVMLVFRVPDVDGVAREWLRQGAEQVAEPTDRPDWGLRTAHFRDPDGNLIELIQRLKR